jgi:predicted metal-dependent enzyme (double-stranded beta helix superfamily)
MISAPSGPQPGTMPLDAFVTELCALPATTFDDVNRIHLWMRRHSVDPETLQPYLSWDRQHYTRNLIFKSNLFELLAICWESGQASSIHNHHDQNCWMAVPIGKLMVDVYHVFAHDREAGTCQLELASSVEMNPDHPLAVDPRQPVHRVSNLLAFSQRAVSLHVYSRPYDHCVVYSAEKGTCGVISLHYTTEYGARSRG